MPRLGWILGFCAMASLGLPGLAGFWGEFPAILSAYSPAGRPQSCRCSARLMVIAAVGTVLRRQLPAVAVPAHRVRRAEGGVHGPWHSRPRRRAAAANDEHHDDIHDVTIFEWIAWTPLLVAIVVFGVYPQLLFKIIDPAVDQLTAVFRK